MADPIHLDRSSIIRSLPQGEPFVFVDSAHILGTRASGTYHITGEECFSLGHFPSRPIFPASILVEALGQLAIVHMLCSPQGHAIDTGSIYFIKSEEVRCARKCIPGDRLDMEVQQVRIREPLIVFSGSIKVSGETALKVSSFTLSFMNKTVES